MQYGREYGKDKTTIFYCSKTELWQQEFNRVKEVQKLEEESNKEDFLYEYYQWQERCKQLARSNNLIAAKLLNLTNQLLDESENLSPSQRLERANRAGLQT